MARPIGFYSILDEEIKFPSATKSSLLAKLDSNLGRSNAYIRDQTADTFMIRHFAGGVSYDPTNFIEKNRNFVSPELIANMRDSTDKIIRFIFTCPMSNTGRLNSSAEMSTSECTQTQVL